MAHLNPAQPATVWIRGYVPTGTDLSTIDSNTSKGVNGDDGNGSDAYAPTSDLVIGGAGVGIAGGGATGANAGWYLATGRVYALISKPITFDRGTAQDYFGLVDAHERASVSPMTNCIRTYSRDFRTVTYAASVLGGARLIKKGGRVLIPFRVYSGGLLTEVIFRIYVVGTYAGLPQNMPKFRVIAMDALGNIIVLGASSNNPDALGYYTYNVVDAAAWDVSFHTVTYNIDTSLAAAQVDVGKYTYFLDYIEESGTNAWGNATSGISLVSIRAVHTDVKVLDGRN